GEPRRDEVVPKCHAVTLRVGLDVLADRLKPGFYTRVELHVPALGDQVAAVDAHALLLGLLVEKVHVGYERGRLRAAGERVALGPEGRGVGADLGQEGVFLHRLGRQGAVEVIDKSDGLLVELRCLRAQAIRTQWPLRAVVYHRSASAA